MSLAEVLEARVARDVAAAQAGEFWWVDLRRRVLLAELAAAIRERDRLTIYVNYLSCRLGIEPHDCTHNRARQELQAAAHNEFG